MEATAPYNRDPKVQTSADASLAPLLAVLADDPAEPFAGLQAVDAVIGHLGALEDFAGEAREFVAIDPDAWYAMKVGLIRFLEDARVALKLTSRGALARTEPRRVVLGGGDGVFPITPLPQHGSGAAP